MFVVINMKCGKNREKIVFVLTLEFLLAIT